MALSPHKLLNSEALQKLTERDSDDFASLARKLVQSRPKATIRSTALLQAVEKVFGDREYSAAICSQLVAMATIRRIEAKEISEVYDNIVRTMLINGLSEDQQAWYKKIRNSFLDLLGLESVRLVAKTLHLSTDYSDVMLSSNVITDIRPVFDNDRSEVLGGVVTQTLRIHYVGGDSPYNEQEISLSLDRDDIDKLIKELEKAKNKSKSAKEFLAAAVGDNVLVSGEDTYGFD